MLNLGQCPEQRVLVVPWHSGPCGHVTLAAIGAAEGCTHEGRWRPYNSDKPSGRATPRERACPVRSVVIPTVTPHPTLNTVWAGAVRRTERDFGVKSDAHGIENPGLTPENERRLGRAVRSRGRKRALLRRR